MSNKEIERIIRALKTQGWRIETGKHYVCFPPDRSKSPVTVSKTPGKQGAIAAIKRDLRRSGATI
jgi:hypothetical protein